MEKTEDVLVKLTVEYVCKVDVSCIGETEDARVKYKSERLKQETHHKLCTNSSSQIARTNINIRTHAHNQRQTQIHISIQFVHLHLKIENKRQALHKERRR